MRHRWPNSVASHGVARGQWDQCDLRYRLCDIVSFYISDDTFPQRTHTYGNGQNSGWVEITLFTHWQGSPRITTFYSQSQSTIIHINTPTRDPYRNNTIPTAWKRKIFFLVEIDQYKRDCSWAVSFAPTHRHDLSAEGHAEVHSPQSVLLRDWGDFIKESVGIIAPVESMSHVAEYSLARVHWSQSNVELVWPRWFSGNWCRFQYISFRCARLARIWLNVAHRNNMYWNRQLRPINSGKTIHGTKQ